MSHIFGFPVIALKKCIFSEFSLQKSQYFDLNLQKLADHKTLKIAVGHYAKSGEDNNEKVIKDLLKVPNLIFSFEQKHEVFRRFGHFVKFRKSLEINKDWLSNLKVYLKKYDKSECNYLKNNI